MAKLGTVINEGFDADRYERRKRLDALANCPECGAEVECWADTEEWTETPTGFWRHSSYGGSMGVCEKCSLLIADCLSDGFQVFDLNPAKAAPEETA